MGPLSATAGKRHEPSRAFNNLFIAYSRAFNKRLRRTGALFERPSGRQPINSIDQLLTLITYSHHNPQRHNLVADFRDWPCSSYGALCTLSPAHLARAEVLAWFDGRSPYITIHTAATGEGEPWIGPISNVSPATLRLESVCKWPRMWTIAV